MTQLGQLAQIGQRDFPIAHRAITQQLKLEKKREKEKKEKEKVYFF